MDKKGGLVLSVIILVVVFVAGAIVGGPIVSTVAQSPSSLSKAFVNAHECTRDEVCEMNGAQIDDVIIDGKFVYTRNGSTSSLVLYGDSGAVLIDSNLGVDGITTFTSPTGNEIIINPGVEFPILVSSWIGPIQNGTAYVCVNNQGQLFRSQTPCV